MTLHDVKCYIEKAGIPNDLYYVGEEFPNEAYCIYENEGVYYVYYAERGSKQCEKSFADAEQALSYMMPLLLKYKQAREEGRERYKGMTSPVVAQVAEYHRIKKELHESKRDPTLKEKMTMKSTQRLLNLLSSTFKS